MSDKKIFLMKDKNIFLIKDKKYIIAGLAFFIALFTFPFWYNSGKAAPGPEIKLTDMAKEAKECVMPTAYMRAEHMQLLDIWRQSVVRNSDNIYVNPSGKAFTMSLSNTCLDCHSNKAEFCDKCHDYASVRPYCFDCHIDKPKEIK
jgi:hypothetical protein